MNDLSYAEGRVLIARTRRVLETMQAEQEALGRELAATGIVGIADRLDWLAAHANPLDQLAAELNAARLAGFRAPHDHLGMRRPIRRMPRYIPTPAQLEIALRVIDNQKVDAA